MKHELILPGLVPDLTPKTPKVISTEGMNEMELKLRGYGLLTADILYRMPDHPRFLQRFVFQRYDIDPQFPELNRFLEFWQDTIEGPLHSLRYVMNKLISPAEWRQYKGEMVIQ